MELKDFRKKTFAVFMFNVFLYFEEIFAKMVKNCDKKKKRCGHQNNPRSQMSGFFSFQRHITWDFYHGWNLIFKRVMVDKRRTIYEETSLKKTSIFLNLASNVKSSVK